MTTDDASPGLSPVTGPGDLTRLRRRGFLLEYASMAWMTVEAAIAITAGVLASSVALTGFGLDSVIEFLAAAVVVWQLRREQAGQATGETRAVRIIGITFFALAAYLTAEAIRDLAAGARPEHSLPGLAVTAAALAVMPALAAAKYRTGRALGSRTLLADAAETAFCAATSAATLIGTGLNAWAGWWQADPVAALVIAALAVREGLEAWQSEDDEADEDDG
jgi:divalent metal cation (Fe/Co/Zn/Cd) transporter